MSLESIYVGKGFFQSFLAVSPPTPFYFSSCDFLVNSLCSLPPFESGGGFCTLGKVEENKAFRLCSVVFIHFSSSESKLTFPHWWTGSCLFIPSNRRSSPLLPSPLYSFHLLSPFTSLFLLHLLISSHFQSLPPPITHLLTQKICLEMR